MSLDPLFYPKSVAVIGASDNLGGGKLPYFQILQANGFTGALYPVNPRRAEVSGVKTCASIDDLPEPVDFAIVARPSSSPWTLSKRPFASKSSLSISSPPVLEKRAICNWSRKSSGKPAGTSSDRRPQLHRRSMLRVESFFPTDPSAGEARFDRLPGTVRRNHLQLCGHGNHPGHRAQ